MFLEVFWARKVSLFAENLRDTETSWAVWCVFRGR